MDPTRQSEPELPKAKIREQSKFSFVWFIPLIAAIVAGWLVFNEVREAGPVISIQFENGNEIIANQTTIRYRGVRVGTVRSVELTRDAQHVEVRARLDRSAENLARNGSLFWIVHPEVGAGGLRGLETIVSGPYIEVQPGSGGKQKKFTGAEEPPILETSAGLHIVLTTAHLGELNVGSPVYYRGIEVGSVEYFILGSDSTTVNVHILIETNFAPLIRTDSQFWNAGGISAHFGLFSGFSMNAETFKSLIIGGIAFATPAPPGISATNDSIFPLNEKMEKKWLDWSPAIVVTNASVKMPQDSPSSILLNSVSPNSK